MWGHVDGGGSGKVEGTGYKEQGQGNGDGGNTGAEGTRLTSFVTVSRFGLFMLLALGSALWRREDLARMEVRCVRTS